MFFGLVGMVLVDFDEFMVDVIDFCFGVFLVMYLIDFGLLFEGFVKFEFWEFLWGCEI